MEVAFLSVFVARYIIWRFLGNLGRAVAVDSLSCDFESDGSCPKPDTFVDGKTEQDVGPLPKPPILVLC